MEYFFEYFLNICPSAIYFLLQKYFLKHFARDNFIKHKFLIFEKSVPNWCSGGEIKVTHMVYRYMRLWLGKIENSWICTEERAKYVQQINERYDILDIITPFWKWDIVKNPIYLFGQMINCDCQSFKSFGIVSQTSPKSFIFAVLFIQDMFKSCQFGIWGHHFGRLANFNQIWLVMIPQIIAGRCRFFGGGCWFDGIFCKKKKI